MRRVFVDTLYWVALMHPKDQWHQAARKASGGLDGCALVTTDEVLVEVLAALCGAGRILRQHAVMMVRDLPADPAVTIHPQSRESFFAGLTLYESRPDKGYSLTDCISMATMRAEGITEVLTSDDHFAQEGFLRLL